MSGIELKHRFERLGLPLSKLHRVSGVSTNAIKLAFAGDLKTKDATKAAISNAIDRLEQEIKGSQQAAG